METVWKPQPSSKARYHWWENFSKNYQLGRRNDVGTDIFLERHSKSLCIFTQVHIYTPVQCPCTFTCVWRSKVSLMLSSSIVWAHNLELTHSARLADQQVPAIPLPPPSQHWYYGHMPLFPVLLLFNMSAGDEMAVLVLVCEPSPDWAISLAQPHLFLQASTYVRLAACLIVTVLPLVEWVTTPIRVQRQSHTGQLTPSKTHHPAWPSTSHMTSQVTSYL